MSLNPNLVPNRPDLIEVNFLGGREKIDRAWYDTIMEFNRIENPVTGMFGIIHEKNKQRYRTSDKLNVENEDGY
jgi:hypothetical protein